MSWLATRGSLLVRLRDPADQAAWFEFHERYGELIVRYAQRLGLARPDAEDVRQIVLLSLARVMPGFEYSPERGRFRSYLGKVVHRAVDRSRRRPKVPPEELVLRGEDWLHGSVDAGCDPTWEEEWRRHHLRLALSHVRRTFDRRSVQAFQAVLAGRSVPEIAVELGTTEAAVYKAKQRVRDALKAQIARQLEDEDGPTE
ncbi:MAG: sigma-70 family RNA polymerase sigma factor [Candidatus Eisenbacteria bacterium]|uniref:Sigma-70 family RNA polymerase sigma factor n=1 Tax=Eiseniibacteriota bacterium TaxID=2212470 RepID=A0A956RQY6_UNCEI|nr:sigma-70 family RNA polymerase sigma factor [Candidatus Eisenbacteria bacterium]